MKKRLIKGIDVELFEVISNNQKLEHKKIENAVLFKKNIILTGGFDYKPITQEELLNASLYQMHFFDYTYEVPFYLTYKKGESEKRINTKIIYEKKSNIIQTCYTHLNDFQKLRNSFYFNRLWFQKSSNIMWLINILIAFLAVMATISKCSKS